MQTFNEPDFRQQLEEELTGNILPFWMTYVVDKVNGGFYGAVTNDLQVDNKVPRSAILCARILWTYATACRRLGAEQYISMARWAYDYLTRVFWDQDYGGVYWHVDYKGTPVFDRKHHYAQAFAIYGLTEYYRATIVSFGHDIEGSWLLLEAAEVQGDPALTAQVRESVISMAEAEEAFRAPS